MREFIINNNDAHQRLDKFIKKTVKNIPDSMLYKSIRTKKIKVNRKRAEISYLLCEGDSVQMFLPEDLFEGTEQNNFYKNLTPYADVVYEDENMLICNKAFGMLSHSDESENVNTLISHITSYLYRKGEFLPENENSFAPALCNRLDRNTGGLIIAAKNAAALRELNLIIKSREVTKKYLCAVHGIFPEKEGILEGYIIKDEKTNSVKVYKNDPGDAGSKRIRTGYKVLKEKDGLSLLEVDLFTGRTHQIRAHLASIGHPLLGDGKYGVNRADKKIGYKYQALYSYKLEFQIKRNDSMMRYLDGKVFYADKKKAFFLKEFE